MNLTDINKVDGVVNMKDFQEKNENKQIDSTDLSDQKDINENRNNSASDTTDEYITENKNTDADLSDGVINKTKSVDVVVSRFSCRFETKRLSQGQ